MGGDYKRLFHIAAMAVGLAMAHAAVSNPALAEQRRVVVTRFKGPDAAAELARRTVIESLTDIYEVVPYSKYRIARRRLNIRKLSMKTLAKVSRRIGADAVILGEVDGARLKLHVREGSSGRLIDRFAIKFARRGLSERAREDLTDELVDFIDSTDPVGARTRDDGGGGDRGDDASDGGEADEAPKAAATAAGPEKPSWAVDTVARLDAEERRDAVPSPVRIRAAVGASGVIRSLQFSFQPDLDDDERPMQQRGTPTMNAAFSGTLDIIPLGISAELSYERSIGAKISFPDGNTFRELPIAASHLAGRVVASRDIGERYGVHGNVGYGQLGYAIRNKPNGLLIPDSRYAYLHIGGGARLRFRDDRVALIASVDYVHVLSAGGITARSAYGSAATRGIRGDGAIEIKTSETTNLRLGVRGTQITMAFYGDGDLGTGLDESTDLDVSGAADTYVGGYAMVGFQFQERKRTMKRNINQDELEIVSGGCGGGRRGGGGGGYACTNNNGNNDFMQMFMMALLMNPDLLGGGRSGRRRR